MPDEGLLRIGREIFLAAFGVPLENVDSWVIDRLTSILEEQQFHRGSTLFTAGEPVRWIYFMQDGEVRFTREGGPSWTLRGRWVIGAFEALGDGPVARTATAVGDFFGMRASAPAWGEMLEDSFLLARSAVVNASRTLARLEERIPTGDPASARGASLPPAVAPGKLGLVERLAHLLDLRMLRAAGVQVLADLAAASREVSFDADAVIVERGAEREHLIQIVDGDVLAERDGPAVRRRFGPGDLICAAPILGGVADAWQARATTPTRAISFPVEALFDLMEEHFDLIRSTLAAMSSRRELLLEHLAARPGELVLT